jgi:hypothetical protein
MAEDEANEIIANRKFHRRLVIFLETHSLSLIVSRILDLFLLNLIKFSELVKHSVAEFLFCSLSYEDYKKNISLLLRYLDVIPEYLNLEY